MADFNVLDFNPRDRRVFLRGAVRVAASVGPRPPEYWADRPDESLSIILALDAAWREAPWEFGTQKGGIIPYMNRWIQTEDPGLAGCAKTNASGFVECFRSQVDMRRFPERQRGLPEPVLTRADLLAYMGAAAYNILTRNGDEALWRLFRGTKLVIKGVESDPLPDWASVGVVTKFMHGCGGWGAVKHMVALNRVSPSDDPTDSIARLVRLGHPRDAARLANSFFVAYGIEEFRQVALGKLVYELD
jgi:hypothetical protein